jgi:hypothetical protein
VSAPSVTTACIPLSIVVRTLQSASLRASMMRMQCINEKRLDAWGRQFMR